MTTPPTNITTRGQRRRAVLGLTAWTGGIALTAWIYPRDVSWLMGWATLPFFLLGALGVIQALTKT